MKTDALLRPPSFLRGMSRVFDLFGQLNEAPRRDCSDAELIQADWEAVGADMKTALKQYEQKSYH